MAELEDYFTHLERRNLAARTLRSYRTILDRCASVVDLRGATTEELEAWLDAQGELSASSRNTYISALLGFYRWRHQVDGSANPAAGLVRPKIPPRLPRPASREGLERALSAATAMLRAWLCLAAYQGLRCCEIAGLQVRDIAPGTRPSLRLSTTKGMKPRVVPLGIVTIAALSAHGIPEAGPVFLDRQGRPFTASEVSRQGAAHLRASGVDATMHQLRHLFGTALYAETRDLLLVSKLMGHSRTDTTAGYARVVLDDRAFEAVNRLGGPPEAA